MAETTAIEWCDATLNLWWGCTKVSEGCKHCYADTLSTRFGFDSWGPKGTRREVKGWRDTLRKISKRAKSEGRRLRVFCQSMSDTFEGPETCGGIESENWALMSRLRLELICAICDYPELDFLILTKRPENAAIYFAQTGPKSGATIPEMCPNLWIGTSVENQETADQRIPHLLKINASVRFLSCEPLLGAVDLSHWLFEDCDHCEGGGVFTGGSSDPQDEEDCSICQGSGLNTDSPLDEIHWVICGGESGAKARPMHPDWARSLRDQCQAAGVPFLFKQWGEWAEDDPGRIGGPPHCGWVKPSPEASHSYPKEPGRILFGKSPRTLKAEGFAYMSKVGKKAAGRLLDGREWTEFPKVEVMTTPDG